MFAMTQTNQRLNNIITKALQTSSRARTTHEKYYKKAYTYATTPVDDTKLAYVETLQKVGQPESVRVILVMSNEDDALTMGVHHELEHILQKQKAKEKSIPINSPKMGLNEKIARKLVHEAHARVGEVEGPLLGFFSDLLQGNTKNIGYYKKHFSVKETANSASEYMNSLLDIQTKAYNMSAGVDNAGYVFINQFSQLDADQKEKAMIRARKATVKQFFSKPSLMKNNSTVDYYIANALHEHESNKSVNKLFAQREEIDALLSGKSFSSNRDEIVPLNKILETTEGYYGPCMSQKDWYEVLGAQSNDKLVIQNIVGSQHIDLYRKATAHDRGKQANSFGYNF